MRLTTKGRYAVTALLDMALHEAQWPIRLAEIAVRQHIPLSYLEQLTGRLRQCGLLSSVRGPGGGYCLGKPASEITVADILLAAQEPIDVTRCGGSSTCQAGSTCLTHGLWQAMNQEILQFFTSITLSDLAKRPEIMAIAERQDALVAQTRDEEVCA